MIEYDESEFQKCAVSPDTYAITERLLGRTVADQFLYKPPDGGMTYDRSDTVAVGEKRGHQLSSRGRFSAQTEHSLSHQTSTVG